LPGIARTLSRARNARPLPLLAGLVAIQLAVALVVALTSTHNHFVWYSGGDATEYWTASWWLSHGQLGQTLIGYGAPVLWAWLPPLAGTTMLAGLPAIVAIQVVLFVPLALVLFWAVADRLFGRPFAWWAAVVWIAAPLLMLAGFSSSYAPQFRDMFLAPHWYGLTGMADFLSLVAVLAATWSALRLLERRTVEDGVLAGLLAGATIGLKPSNGFFLVALLVLLAGVRSVRPLLAFAGGFAPALVTLAVWKERGRGTLPLLSGGAPRREAAGGGPIATLDPSPYLHFDWAHLQHELSDLGGVFWSVRLLEFVAVAGAIAVLRRDRLKGAFVIVWFAGFCIAKGSSPVTSIVSVSYFRLVAPGLPAFVLLAASLVFLLPRRGAPFAEPERAAVLPRRRATVAVAALVLGVIPLVVVAAASPAAQARYVWFPAIANDAPLSDDLAVTAANAPGGVRLSWRPASTHGAGAYYGIYRSSTGDGCTFPTEGARECDLTMEPVTLTRGTSYVDHPGPGRHWYRVGLLANYRDATDGSDLMLIGPATAVAASR
jgi:hypothetical protein